jgi:DNA repair protein RadA
MTSAVFPLKLAPNLQKSSKSYSLDGIEIITQLEDDRITQSRDDSRGIRQYISTKKIRLLAQTKFEQSGEGLTCEDLANDGPYKCVDDEQRARDTLHYHHKKRHLFTIGRKYPQQYFASPDDAEKATIYREKNTHSHPTGVKYSTSPNGQSSSSSRNGPPLANALEHYEAENFLHALLMLKVAPLEMHNLRLDIQLIDPRRYYDIIPLTYREEKKNKAKVHEERIGNVYVTFRVYPKGTVVISIACSKSPFRIETDWGVSKLFSFVGEVRSKLQQWLRDLNASIVPPIERWRLIHADINKDVNVPPHFQLTFLKMQIPTADKVLRLYVKNLGHQTVLRLEHVRVFNEAFGNAVNSLRRDTSSSPTAALDTHSINPAVFVEKAEQDRKIVMLMSRVAELEEMILESRKEPTQEVRLKKETTSSEQIDVTHKKEEEFDNKGKLGSSNHDDYNQGSYNNPLSIAATNYVDVENNSNKTETSEVWQQQEQLQKEQEQQSIVIPPSATVPEEDVPIKITSAADLLKHRNNINNQLRISTGSKELDDLLGGGIERGAVTELIGPAGTGKSELCLTLSVMAQQEQKRKLEKTSVDDGCNTITYPTRVLFLGINKPSYTGKIDSIAQARGIDADAAVESITVEMLQDFQALEQFILKKLEEFLKKNPETVLVIVDSIIALQPLQRKQGRKKKGEKYDLLLWQRSEYSPIYLLRKVASEYNIAVVVINEAETIPDCYYEQTQIPIVGNIISRASTYRISFKNHDNYKFARIIHSPCHPEGEATFTIERQGVTDIHQ